LQQDYQTRFDMDRYSSLLVLVSCVLFAPSVSGQAQKNATSLPTSDEAPPEIVVLKHALEHQARLVNEMSRDPQTAEPATAVRRQSVTFISVAVKSATTKTIVGVSWYFVLQKGSEEELFRVPFITQAHIESAKTKAIKGELDMASLLRRHPQTLTVDQLKNPVRTPAQERIVISCLLFSDGTFSRLNDSAKQDCQRLATIGSQSRTR
jgi:hypothetical protein